MDKVLDEWITTICMIDDDDDDARRERMFEFDFEKFVEDHKRTYRADLDKEHVIRLARFLVANARKIDTIRHLRIPKDEIFLVCFLFSSFIFLSEERIPKDGAKVYASLELDDISVGDESFGSWLVKLGLTRDLIYEVRKRTRTRDTKLSSQLSNLFDELEQDLELDNQRILFELSKYLVTKTLEKKEEGKIVTNYLKIEKPYFSLLVARTR